MKNVEASQRENLKKQGSKTNLVKRFFGFLSLFMFVTLSYAQDVAQDIEDLFEDQIQPIVNVIVMVGIILAAVYAGILFFQGKKEGLKNVGFIIAGVLVIKFMASIAEGILSN